MRAGGEGGELGRPRPGVAGASAQRPLSPQMYAYALALFSQAGISQDKIQYVAIGTGGCELLATLLSVSMLRADPQRLALRQTLRMLTLGMPPRGVFTLGVQTVGVFTFGVQTVGVQTLGVLMLQAPQASKLRHFHFRSLC